MQTWLRGEICLFTELHSRCQNRPVANEHVCELDRSTGLITSEERQRASVHSALRPSPVIDKVLSGREINESGLTGGGGGLLALKRRDRKRRR